MTLNTLCSPTLGTPVQAMKSAFNLGMTNLSTDNSSSILGEITEVDEPQQDDEEGVYPTVADPEASLALARHTIDPAVVDPEVSQAVAGHSVSHMEEGPACTAVPQPNAEEGDNSEEASIPAQSSSSSQQAPAIHGPNSFLVAS